VIFEDVTFNKKNNSEMARKSSPDMKYHWRRKKEAPN